MFKKFNIKAVMLLIIGILMLSLAACASSTKTNETAKTPDSSSSDSDKDSKKLGPVLTRVKETGVITTAFAAQTPPWRFHKMVNGKDTLAGFEVDLVNYIADEVGKYLGVDVKLEVKELQIDGTLAALQADKVDFAPTLSATEERKKNLDFSIPYHRSLQTIAIRTADKDKDIFKEENQLAGVKVGSIKGSSTSITMLEKYPKAELFELSKAPDILLSLLNDKIDAAVFNEKQGILYVKANPEIMLVDYLKYDVPKDRDPGASVAFPKGNEDFVALVDEILNRILNDGTFAGFEKKSLEDLNDPDLLKGFSGENILNQ
jgi:arginine/lysine/histidine transporter system substrate-binding protein